MIDANKKTIFIVDDKAAIAKILALYFSRDYHTVHFDNPLPAIEALQAGNIPDLIISDIRMPQMRGDEFLHFIKKNELFSSIPVIMLSSEDSTSERIRLLSEGAEDYMVKPFNPQELKVRVQKILK
ncbi:MAG: response regulator transcription factor [Alistipes sp.]|nr:response regulator transcription factor [Alistipes sp.]